MLKLRFLDYVSEAKMEEYHQKTWNVSDKCGINATCLALYHLKVVTPVTMKAATKASLRSKKLWKLRFSGYFSKAKMKECHQKNYRKCNKIGMRISSTATNFLEVGAGFSLKVANKPLFRGQATLKMELFTLFL